MAELPFQAEYAKSGRASCKGCKKKIDQGVLRIAVMVQSAFFDGKQANWHHEECFFRRARVPCISAVANFNKLKQVDKARIKQAIESTTGIVMPAVKGKGKKGKRAAPAKSNPAIKDFSVEYAKSSRSTCKHCEIKICKDEVRICKMMFDTEVGMKYGGQPYWHHVSCFEQERDTLGYNAGAEDLPGFKNLTADDQKMVKEKIKARTTDEVPTKKIKTEPKDEQDIKKELEHEKTLEKQNKLYHKYRKALSEYSKKELQELLEANSQDDALPVNECLDRLADNMAFGVPDPCPECQGQLVLDTFNYKCTGSVSEWTKCCYTTSDPPKKPFVVPSGFKKSSAFQKYKPTVAKRLFDAAPPLPVIAKTETPQARTTDEVPTKKIKTEPKDEQDIKKELEHEKTLEKQNKLYHKYRKALSEYSKKELQELLEANSQDDALPVNECLDRLADNMAFGVPDPCPECQGQLVLDTFNYKCTGSVSEWTKCCYTTSDPPKKPFVVPSGFKKSSAFQKYKPTIAKRLFDAAPPLPVIVKTATPQEKKNIPIPPLKNLQFFIYGKAKNKEEIKCRILKLGGLVVCKLTNTTAAVVSTQKEVEKMPAKMTEIQEKDIEVVEESFLDLIDPATGTIANTLELIKLNSIAPWGSDPVKRVPQDVIDGKSIPKSGSMYVKSQKSTTTKIRVKGGTAVDPDSGLEDVAHVYNDHDGTKYTVVLCKTDIVAQKNSYYKLQVLEADSKNKYWLFRAWGRIGTTIGGHKVEQCKSKENALDRFQDLFMEKTENPWEYRNIFRKVPNGYYPIELDYGDDENDGPRKELQVDKNCKLPVPVQQLVVRIFDINIMKKTLLEFELDTEKMPLGKLSKKQIKSGYKVLSQILVYIAKGKASNSHVVDATNRFYTTVPHDFGIKNPPLLYTEEAIKKKIEMLDNLLEIEIAYSLLKTESDDTSSPIESHYMKLKANIAPLDTAGDEFKLISEYVQNTHAATHSNYTLEIEQVFKVVREGEDKRFKPFKKLHNRRLLWHGSRVTNFAGILSQGLRIAPPEAPVTGYMFGKGIYFADMVSKSANYCCTNKANPMGIMLLCEVALGDMKKCHQAEMITKLPPGQHSVWGIGRTQPDPTQNRVLDDGTVVPMGKPVTNPVNTSLLYNEFIVYDVAQVNVKYLLQMKFNHKY